MRNLFLSAALIAIPIGVFAAVESVLPPAPAPEAVQAAAPSDTLGDLSPFQAIVADTQRIADGGDLKAAETRITDFETLWDTGEPTMRPMDPVAWGRIDGAADAAFSALRAKAPDPAKVDATLAGLSGALDGTAAPVAAGGVQSVQGIAVTDAAGHPVPCEDMLNQLRAAPASSDAAVAAKVADLQAKGTERCNADDDRRADDFFAQGLALLAK